MRLRKHVLFNVTTNGGVLLDERRGSYWEINETGAHSLQLLLAGKSDREAAENIATRYQIDNRSAVEDLRNFLSDLTTAGLVDP
jgi:hypothetical protein